VPQPATEHRAGGPDAARQDILTRLARIEGQIRGIQKMVREGKECEAVLIQVKAAQSALRAATARIVQHTLTQCRSGGPDEAARSLERLAEVISRFLD